MKVKANLAALGFATIFGCSFLASKIVLEYLSPFGLLAFRYLLAFITFEVLRLLKIVKVDLSKKAFKLVWWIVLFQPIMYFIFETFGLSLAKTSEAGLMLAIIPIVVALLSAVILKEKLSLLQVICIIMTIIGIGIIQLSEIGNALNSNKWGIVLLFGAVISAALFNIFSRKSSHILSPITITYYMVLGGAIVFNSAYFIEKLASNTLAGYFNNLFSWKVGLSLLYLGVISSIGGFFLVNYSLARLPAPISSLYSNLSTVITIIIGVLVLDEKLTIYHYLGSLLIILGVYLSIAIKPYKKISV